MRLSRTMHDGRGRLVAAALVLFLVVPLAVQAQVETVDDLGNRIVLPHPARRIVSLAPHNTENLFTAGAGQWLAGTVAHSDYPPAAGSVPRVGNYKQVNVESLLALQPDLVVVWASGNPPELLDKLEKLGLNLFYSEPKTFPQVVDNIRRLAILAGTETTTRATLKQLLAKYTELKDSHRGLAPVSVFYQLWNEPLITLNGNQLVTHAIEVCGGRNVFADLPMLAPRINVEGVLAQDPDVILLATHDGKANAWADRWRRWKSLRAVKNHHIYSVDGNLLHRHTARFLLGMQRVCEILDQVREDSEASRKRGVTMGMSG